MQHVGATGEESGVHLLECLQRIPVDQLKRIIQSTGIETEGGQAEQLLADRLLNRSWLKELLDGLSEEEWAALKVVFFNGGDQGITVELCHQIVNLLSGKRRKSPARAVEDLQNRGLIYPRTQNYRQVFFIPTDLMGALGDILHRQMVHRICLQEGEAVRPAAPERDLVEDIHRFLAYVYKNEITLTQQGQVFKRHMRALLDLLNMAGEDEESLVGRYPEPLGLLVGYGLDRRLAMREDGRLLPSPTLSEWVEQPMGVKQLDLFRYWQDRYFYQDLQTFLSVMRTVGLQWLSVSRLVAEVEPLINPSQRGSFLLRLKHHLSTFLAPLGLCDLGQTGPLDEPELACRVTQAGLAVLEGAAPDVAGPGGALAQPALLLQATFEAIVPRPVPPKVLWNLELMADLIRRTDRTLTYRLGRQSVYRALKTGLSGEEILGFLAAHSGTGVPQNVAFDLKSWADSFGQVYLQSVTILRCASPILAQQVKASRRTARFVVGELSPTDLIVREPEYKDLLEALEADGLMPRPGIDRPGHE
ncbi:MAG TPA: helicase-associated domain-containing protein [Symbiobacteriaceae bacterium]|nr:helicase-associated domain-containing protein [Symbiobacteriaceae bacterium]